jgi:hypothetical protein
MFAPSAPERLPRRLGNCPSETSARKLPHPSGCRGARRAQTRRGAPAYRAERFTPRLPRSVAEDRGSPSIENDRRACCTDAAGRTAARPHGRTGCRVLSSGDYGGAAPRDRE